ncbi:hypothetical protein [Rummeliibacillus pycnus]|uniref:hypothetical protein n=1 Tax=Rummeliibacillus pycnus TaxID=101070 RepID=UPI000C9C21A0|nr:hypothetical protein [Rummeliibacillus pycnus]
MQVTEWYSLKTLMIPSSWVALVSSFVLMWLLLRVLYRKEIANIFLDAVLQLILVWKFSVIVTDFSMVIKQPLTILYFNGGMMGFGIGILFMCGTLWYKFHQNRLKEDALQAVFMTIILCSSSYQIWMASLNDATLWQKALTITGFSCWIILALWKRKEKPIWHRQLLLLFLCTHVLIATLQPLGIWQLSVFVTFIFVIFNLTLKSNHLKIS